MSVAVAAGGVGKEVKGGEGEEEEEKAEFAGKHQITSLPERPV
jgi:hypothetical protein